MFRPMSPGVRAGGGIAGRGPGLDLPGNILAR